MLTALGRRSRSVSFRAGLWSALSVGAVAAVAGFLVVSLVYALFAVTGDLARTGLIDRAEDQLLLGVPPQELSLPTIEELNEPAGPPPELQAFWAVVGDGAVLRSSGPVDLDVIAAEFSDLDVNVRVERAVDSGEQIGVRQVDGRDWLVVERIVEAPDGASYSVITAEEGTFGFGSFLRRSLPVLVSVVLLLMAVAMAITSVLTKRALRRVENIRAEVEQITRESLDRRVPTADASDGIDKLAHTMNDMLRRLEAADAKQGRFLADASHELRSPVAGLVAQLDVAATYPDRVDAGALLPKLRGEAERLRLLVDDLLYLGRAEPDGGSRLEGEHVDIDTLIEDEVARQLVLQPDLVVDVHATSNASVIGSSRDLSRAVRNLLDNAVRHCASRVVAKSEVVRSDPPGGEVVVSVIDDGPGVPAEQADRIFDRFVRLDEARSRDAGGTGLGLAITQEIARRHGGSIRLADTTGGPGATFQIVLPCS